MIKLIGIINIDSDSFSNDSVNCIDEALSCAKKAIESDVSVVELGAESTAPLERSVISVEEEWRRLSICFSEVIAMCSEYRVPVSIDTRHFETAEKAINAGVKMINDQFGLGDSRMRELVRDAGIKVIVMRSVTLPAKKGGFISGDPIAHCIEWASRKIDELNKYGIDIKNIILDPGIGFGMSTPQCWDIICNWDRFLEAAKGAEVCIGHSRKSFFNLVTSLPFESRDLETVSLSAFLMMFEEHSKLWLRVHNVEWHRRMMNVIEMANSRVIS